MKVYVVNDWGNPILCKDYQTAVATFEECKMRRLQTAGYRIDWESKEGKPKKISFGCSRYYTTAYIEILEREIT